MARQTTENAKNKNIPFRCTGDRWEVITIAAAKRRTSVQKLLEDGVSLLMGEATSEGTKVKSVPVTTSAAQIDVLGYMQKLEQAQQLIGVVLDGLGGVAVEAGPKTKTIDFNTARNFTKKFARPTETPDGPRRRSKPPGGAGK